MKISNKLFTHVLKPIVFILLLLPALYLGWGLWQDTLGANPLEAVIRGLGDWALRILLITLAVSPIRRLINWGQLLRLRRLLGLYAYFYAILHLLGYLWFEQFFDWGEIWYDITERPFITVGMIALLLLTPLAMTSTKGMIRRMGKQWKRLHLLIYPIAILSVLHFFWMVKLDISEPVIYALILAALLGERILYSLRKNWLKFSSPQQMVK
ncbi:MAG TPA: sulfoxide reductase heme-binding subunit YedZ [Leucothrix mucor]|uniref:Protein-methionine-sulfoxide reductase heme-binding subunit MsrQ n=1 Tax=Leucothrix mucor TaxID=45248 RepID=A0A7V2T1K5_LEUMU|nr:sulfoxide reductase heme-binding subunit YedZ [Leucothrix mucor]